MGPENGDFVNLASQIAMCQAHKDSEGEGNEYVDKLLDSKGEVDKEDVVNHLDDFSCQEELDRYVDHQSE